MVSFVLVTIIFIKKSTLKIMENTTTKALWQKPEMIDLDIDLTDSHLKAPTPVEDGPIFGPS